MEGESEPQLGEEQCYQPSDGQVTMDDGEEGGYLEEQYTEHDSEAPPVDEHQYYAADPSDWQPDAQEIQAMEERLRPIQSQLEYLLDKADEYQAHLIHRRDRVEGLSRVVPTFLKTCQPLFTYMEHTARSCLPHRPPLPIYIRTRLLQFSQQLCSRLEELILTYAAYNFLTLEETNPLSISHFFIGECQVNHIHLSMFRYCQPAPFMPAHQSPSYSYAHGQSASSSYHHGHALSNSLFKVMRWNVVRLPERGMERDGGEQDEIKNRDVAGWRNSSEYYFLCYEEVLREGDEGGEEEEEEEGEERKRRRRESEGVGPSIIRMWSIGQWIQTHPNPHTQDIYEWILCGSPKGHYHELFYLGASEPSTCSATDCLLGALLSYESQ
ncbi:UPF0575 protein C19orf67 homolog [Engraulis encrasicolus]|uniref:UPF0575 protein C19orf67 homolog n=1 Tax=Engraulis encrasicolus TaxID=184585 RepID=UPI002FD22233